MPPGYCHYQVTCCRGVYICDLIYCTGVCTLCQWVIKRVEGDEVLLCDLLYVDHTIPGNPA